MPPINASSQNNRAAVGGETGTCECSYKVPALECVSKKDRTRDQEPKDMRYHDSELALFAYFSIGFHSF
jgi:hypothetical protein